MDQHRSGFAAMIRSMVWDLGLPAVTYYGLHFAGLGDTAALMAGTGAAGLRLVLTFVTFGALLAWNARYVAARTRAAHALAA